jgi:hypothetical protein
LLDEEAGAATKANALEKFNSLFARDKYRRDRGGVRLRGGLQDAVWPSLVAPLILREPQD